MCRNDSAGSNAIPPQLQRKHWWTTLISLAMLVGCGGDGEEFVPPDLFANDALISDGMWPYDRFPVDRVEKVYGITVTDSWLDNLRTAAININGFSGAFVSQDGLVASSYSAIRFCVQRLANQGTNYFDTGYLASKRDDEIKCPDWGASITVNIENVTEVLDGLPEDQRQQRYDELTEECEQTEGITCTQVTFFNDTFRYLYHQRTYSDVRLVMVPELDAGNFGFSVDDYQYPRHSFNVAFVRVYQEDGRPVTPKHHLRWSTDGPSEQGEPVFATGFGSVPWRLTSAADDEFRAQIVLPTEAKIDKVIQDTNIDFATQSEAENFFLTSELRSWESFIRRQNGLAADLARKDLIDAAAEREKNIIDAINADFGLTKFDGIFDAWRRYRRDISDTEPRAILIRNGLRGVYYSVADQIVRGNKNIKTGPLFEAREETFLITLQEELLIALLTLIRDELGTEDPFFQDLLNGETIQEVASAAANDQTVIDPIERAKLIGLSDTQLGQQGGRMIQLALVEKKHRGLRSDEVKVFRDANPKADFDSISEAYYAVRGDLQAPETDGTIRLSFGLTYGYQEDDGDVTPWQTTFSGMLDKADSDNDNYALPRRWTESDLDPETPINFVSTHEDVGKIIVNASQELIGIGFDSNQYSFAREHFATIPKARSIAVHSLGILRILCTVYKAKSLVDEILGKESSCEEI